jgi:hypothetical protein
MTSDNDKNVFKKHEELKEILRNVIRNHKLNKKKEKQNLKALLEEKEVLLR